MKIIKMFKGNVIESVELLLVFGEFCVALGVGVDDVVLGEGLGLISGKGLTKVVNVMS